MKISIPIDRVEFVRRRIAERRALAETFRAQALGNSVAGAEVCLTQAAHAESHANGMENALNILLNA